MAANARKRPVFVDLVNIFAYFAKLTFNAVYLKDRKFGVSFKRNRNDKVNQKSSNMLLKKRRISMKNSFNNENYNFRQGQWQKNTLPVNLFNL